MIHQRKLSTPCPSCTKDGQFGVLYVRANRLVTGCSICGFVGSRELPTLTKTVVYLDQCFLSSAFRSKQPKYVEALGRITDLAQQQLVVCPWSDLHETETHQWSDDRQGALWEFVKRTASGHRFIHSASLKRTQLSRGFSAHLTQDGSGNSIDRDDAFSGNIHEWDSHIWIDIRSRVDNVEEVRKSKEATAKGMASLFDKWRESPKSFADDFREECYGYASTIENDYLAWIRPNEDRTLSGLLGSWNAQVFNSLMIEQGWQEPFDDRLRRARNFLRSDFFSSVPHVDASCRIMAALRRAIRRGELPTEEAAEKAMFGFGQDMEMVSVFAPYVDAVFLDSQMHRWITEADCELPSKYGFRAFSAKSWDEFHAFLDEVESKKPPDRDGLLRMIYG